MRSNKTQHITELTLSVFRLNGALVDWGDYFSAPEELTSARWQMLGALTLAGQPLTAPQIANSMGVTRQGAQKQLNLLVDSGLIPCALFLANRAQSGLLDSSFYGIQVMELTAGAINLILLSLNFRDGLRSRYRRRQ